MKEVTLSNYEIFAPRLDWLSVLGENPHIDRTRDLDALRVAIFRLKKRGFFLKFHWSNNGMRVFHLDPKIYQ